jgi:hypothetical protein
MVNPLLQWLYMWWFSKVNFSSTLPSARPWAISSSITFTCGWVSLIRSYSYYVNFWWKCWLQPELLTPCLERWVQGLKRIFAKKYELVRYIAETLLIINQQVKNGWDFCQIQQKVREFANVCTHFCTNCPGGGESEMNQLYRRQRK